MCRCTLFGGWTQLSLGHISLCYSKSSRNSTCLHQSSLSNQDRMTMCSCSNSVMYILFQSCWTFVVEGRRGARERWRSTCHDNPLQLKGISTTKAAFSKPWVVFITYCPLWKIVNHWCQWKYWWLYMLDDNRSNFCDTVNSSRCHPLNIELFRDSYGNYCAGTNSIKIYHFTSIGNPVVEIRRS